MLETIKNTKISQQIHPLSVPVRMSRLDVLCGGERNQVLRETLQIAEQHALQVEELLNDEEAKYDLPKPTSNFLPYGELRHITYYLNTIDVRDAFDGRVRTIEERLHAKTR